jgi:hypothetical protein
LQEAISKAFPKCRGEGCGSTDIRPDIEFVRDETPDLKFSFGDRYKVNCAYCEVCGLVYKNSKIAEINMSLTLSGVYYH